MSLKLRHMALFNFNRSSVNSNDNNGSNGVNNVIRLIINDETIEVPTAQAEGLNIRQVFERFASDSCDVTRINRFVAQGRIINGSTAVEGGNVYSGAIASESKG